MDDFSQKHPQQAEQDMDSLGKRAEEIYERAQNGSLNHEIEATLNTVFSSVASGVGKAMEQVSEGLEKGSAEAQRRMKENQVNQNYGTYGQRASGQKINYQESVRRNYAGQYGNRTNQNQVRSGAYRTASGNASSQKRKLSICRPPKSGIGYRIVGGCITGVFGFVELLFLFLLGVTGEAGLLIPFGILFPFLAAGAALLGVGLSKKKRLGRYMKYVRELQGKAYGLIEEMAKSTNKSKSYTVKDLRNMIADGIFPDGHIDNAEEYLMVTREVYEDYRKAEQSRKERAAEEALRTQEQKSKEEEKAAQARNQAKMTEVEKTVAEGRRYLVEIYQANEALPEEEISNKLDRLYEVVDRILQCVERQPEKLEDIRQFMKYYLPTTLKLVKTYQQFEENPIQGSNILAAKKEIALSLDTINDGFERLLNNLFEQDAIDISTDIYVLQNMLAREGLAHNPFEDISRELEQTADQSKTDMPDPFGDADLEEGSVLRSNE